MTPHVLIVGGTKGSWQVRGIQIGRAIGARVATAPTAEDWAWADCCILVKRALGQYAAIAQAHGVPIIWDALDFWRQPEENGLSIADAIALAHAQITQCGVDLVIGATEAMADDLGGVALAHHSRPRLVTGPVREQLSVVAYEGTPKYLGSWRSAVEAACARLGATFVVNPPDLRDADVIVAFRGEQWDGALCRRWKSGVKCVNALAAGRPLITQPSAAGTEIAPPGVTIDDPACVEDALAAFRSLDARLAVAQTCAARAGEYQITSLARRYRSVVETLLRRAA